MHIIEADNAADVFKEAFDGLENLTQDDVISIVRSLDQQEGSQKRDEYLPVLDEKQIIGWVGMDMKEIEKAAIDKTLRATGGNKTEAARILGIGVRTIHRRLNDYKQETDEASGTLNQE